MKFRLSEKIYTEDGSEKKFQKQLVRIKRKRPVTGLYVITTPLYEAGIMEIYDYNELLQPYYRRKKSIINILGVSSSRDGAKKLVCEMLEDIYKEIGKPDINEYFGLENAG